MDFQTADKKNGTVTFEGKEYALTTIADYTSTLLLFHTNSVDAQEGETYDFEMAANAIDTDGNAYRVTWIFSDTKGSEKPIDELDYSQPHSVYSL